MEMNYSSYRAEIKNVKYVSDDGVYYPRTAIITFLDKLSNEKGTELYGHLQSSEIYEAIDRGDEIILDNCYVEDFSLSLYRSRRK
ncbi:MAG TPA: hypothetical protein VJ877_08395, partial [Bacteroidales bacterium]|nr:hypothetical protein [Bacteroidales bacterium]